MEFKNKLYRDDPDPALLCLFLNLTAHLAPSFSILESAFSRLSAFWLSPHSLLPSKISCLLLNPVRIEWETTLRVIECLCYFDSCSLDHVDPFPSTFMLITFPGASQVALVVKNLPVSAREVRDLDSIPVSGNSPGGGNGNLLQCSCLENPMDRGAWQAPVHGVAQSQTQLKQQHPFILCLGS